MTPVEVGRYAGGYPYPKELYDLFALVPESLRAEKEEEITCPTP